MTYLEQMIEAPDHATRYRVAEGYTNEFHDIMLAAGLDPACGEIMVDGILTYRQFGFMVRPVHEILSEIRAADKELGERATELCDDVRRCLNILVKVQEGLVETTEEPDRESEWIDRDNTVHVSSCHLNQEDIEMLAAGVVPDEMLRKGKIPLPVRVTSQAPDGPVDNGPFIATWVYRDEDQNVPYAVAGYPVMGLKEFRKTYPQYTPRTLEEAEQQEYNPDMGFYGHTRLKGPRGKATVLLGLTVYGNKLYVDKMLEGYRWAADPTGPSILLDEDVESQVPAPSADIYVTSDPRDELERLVSQWLAVKRSKADAMQSYNAQIKEIEEDIDSLIKVRNANRHNQRLPFDADPVEVEKAIKAAAEESQPEPSESPEPVPADEASEGVGNTEPAAKAVESSLPGPGPDVTEVDPELCTVCEGYGHEPGKQGIGCIHCLGQGYEPAYRVRDKESNLGCFACGEYRPYFRFSTFGTLSGWICSNCRAAGFTAPMMEME